MVDLGAKNPSQIIVLEDQLIESFPFEIPVASTPGTKPPDPVKKIFGFGLMIIGVKPNC
jgi:hypothetical protein